MQVTITCIFTLECSLQQSSSARNSFTIGTKAVQKNKKKTNFFWYFQQSIVTLFVSKETSSKENLLELLAYCLAPGNTNRLPPPHTRGYHETVSFPIFVKMFLTRNFHSFLENAQFRFPLLKKLRGEKNGMGKKMYSKNIMVKKKQFRFPKNYGILAKIFLLELYSPHNILYRLPHKYLYILYNLYISIRVGRTERFFEIFHPYSSSNIQRASAWVDYLFI